jgi:hypothetical protein
MRNGSGIRALSIVAPAGDLVFGRVGGIVRNRLRSAVPSLSLVFEKSNKQLEQSSPAARSCLLNCGVEWLKTIRQRLDPSSRP